MENKNSFTIMEILALILTVLIVTAAGCNGLRQPVESAKCPLTPQEKTMLWNGRDFTDWKLFVEDKSVDAAAVWSAKNGVIHCTGKPFGYMRTLADYTNYKLHVEWRWVEGPSNSGILMHMSEPDKLWPDSIECQLMSGRAGDFHAIGNTDFKERVDKSSIRVPKKAQSSEKPIGQWNTADIFCCENTIRIFINSVLQNEASRTTVSSGKICLQSEGGPIEFRNVYIEPLKKSVCQTKPAPQTAIYPDNTSGFVPICDGKTFAGWEGNLHVFRIQDGAIVGGSLGREVPRNEFLCTTKEYSDFELRLQVKLLGEGANAGIQIRSRRIPNHHEMIGYQADMGQHYWGCLYDESRRRRVLAHANREELDKVLRLADWNDYVIRCNGKRVQLWINGYQTVDYAEPDDTIEQTGIIGLQIHAGPPSEAWYKNIRIKEFSETK